MTFRNQAKRRLIELQTAYDRIGDEYRDVSLRVWELNAVPQLVRLADQIAEIETELAGE